MRMRVLAPLVLAGATLTGSGCSELMGWVPMQSAQKQSQPVNPNVGNRPYQSPRENIRITEERGVGVSEVDNFQFTQDNQRGVVRVSGKLKVVYEMSSVQETISGNRVINYKSVPLPKKEFIPDSLVIMRQDSPGHRAEKVRKGDIESDGSFVFEYEDKSFILPATSKYLSAFQKNIFLRIQGNVSSIGKDSVPALGGSPLVYFVKVNDIAVNRFVDQNVNSKVFNLTLNMRDSNTRTPVGVDKVKIKCKSAPNLEQVLKNEFGGDEALLVAATACTKTNMAEGQARETSGSTIVIPAIEGGVYLVETFDRAYNFTSNEFTADKQKASKGILLTDVGAKVRVEQTREGKTGGVVDE